MRKSRRAPNGTGKRKHLGPQNSLSEQEQAEIASMLESVSAHNAEISENITREFELLTGRKAKKHPKLPMDLIGQKVNEIARLFKHASLKGSAADPAGLIGSRNGNQSREIRYGIGDATICWDSAGYATKRQKSLGSPTPRATKICNANAC